MPKTCFKYLTFFILSGLFLFEFNSCAINPVTGKREINLLSQKDEIVLGKQSDPAIIAQYGLYDDAKLGAFLNEMGQKMAGISHRPNLQFHFRVLDSPVINAFALPGGYVYFTRGILAHMNSEAEVAGVLGHEIGHVTARHGAKAYTRSQLAQVGLTATSLISESMSQISQIAAQGLGLLFLKFGRDQERQSDKLGVQYSTTIGYDAGNMAHFFGTLNRLRSEGGSGLPDWQSTHPNPEEREKTTLKLAKEQQVNSGMQNFQTNREQYLALIDGLVFGEDPRQGFFENEMFFHPQLNFQFPVPAGWKTQNSPQLISMVNSDQTAGLQFTIAQVKSAREAAQKFVADSKAAVTISNSKRVNGHLAEVRQAQLTTENGTLSILSYFIEKDGKVYTFHGFSAQEQFKAHLSSFRRTMDGFNKLLNRQAKQVQPARVRLVKVPKSITLEKFLQKHPSKVLTPEKLAVLNGMELTETIKAGRKIKILTK